MRIESLEIKNFRNLSNVALKDLSRVNIITGENAQGKTNLLESIYFLSTLTSNRAKTNLDLIKWKENVFSLKSGISKNDLKKTLEVNFFNSKELIVKIN